MGKGIMSTKSVCMLKWVATFWLLQSIAVAAQTGPPVGKQSPNLIGRTLDDKLYRLSDDTTQPKVINFFWVECTPCKKEMPELAKKEKTYSKVKFIAVHTKEENPDRVRQFVKALAGAPSIIVLTTGSLQETFNYVGLPHTMVLDKNNVVLANLVGYTPENMQKLKKILNELNK